MQIDEDVLKVLNESDEYTFADWFGQDLTGQTYDGDIDCSGEGLTSLKGAPQTINGDFDCDWNDLTSLEGAPQEVYGEFNCYWNKLTSLEGAPQIVKGDFICNGNQIVSLIGMPKEIKGEFKCDISPDLLKQAKSAGYKLAYSKGPGYGYGDSYYSFLV